MLIDDAAYLIDEITSLKPLIDVIPYEERPGDDLSVLEILISVDSAQTFLLDHHDQNDDINFARFPDKVRSLRGDSATPEMNLVLSNMVKNRKTLLKRLSKSERNKIHLEKLIHFERSQFRQIAERILTITPQD